MSYLYSNKTNQVTQTKQLAIFMQFTSQKLTKSIELKIYFFDVFLIRIRKHKNKF